MNIARFALSTLLTCLALTGCVANMGDGAGRSTANLSFWVQGDLVEVVERGDAFDFVVRRNGAPIATAALRPGEVATVIRSDGHKVALTASGSALEFFARSVHNAATREIRASRVVPAGGVAGSQANIFDWGADDWGDSGGSGDHYGEAGEGRGPRGDVQCHEFNIADGNCVTNIRECNDGMGVGCTTSDRLCKDGTMEFETDCSET